MSKVIAQQRHFEDHSALAVASTVRVSPRKLNLVAALIRGRNAEDALTQLTFSSKRIAVTVKRVLQSAIANADNNHNLDVDQLYVAEAYVGKSLVMKRWQARARSRIGRIRKPFSNLTIIVRERNRK